MERGELGLRAAAPGLSEASITVHYEDLYAQPIALLERLETFTGLSLAGSKAAAAERRVMQPGHALSGNHLMRSERIAFSPKRGLTRHLTRFDKAIVAFPWRSPTAISAAAP